MYFLHSLQWQFWGFHFLSERHLSLIAPLELNPKFLVLGGARFLYHKKCFSGLEQRTQKRDANYTKKFVLKKILMKMVGARSSLSLKNSFARICRSLISHRSVSISDSKDDILSLYTMRKKLSCKWFIIHCTAVKHPY